MVTISCTMIFFPPRRARGLGMGRGFGWGGQNSGENATKRNPQSLDDSAMPRIPVVSPPSAAFDINASRKERTP